MVGAFRRRDGRLFFVAIGLWAIARAVVSTTWRDPVVADRLNAGGLIAIGDRNRLRAVAARRRSSAPGRPAGPSRRAPARADAAGTAVRRGPIRSPAAGPERPDADHARFERPRSIVSGHQTRRGPTRMTQVAEPGSQPRRCAGARSGQPLDRRPAVAGTSGREGPSTTRPPGSCTKHVDFASVEEVDAAVAAARAAFPAWRATSLSKRTDIMFSIRNLVEAHRTELAALLTAEHGKVPSDALGEIARGLENLEFACGIPNLLKGGFSEQVSGGVDVYQIRQPLGVVAGITPFNFPAMVPMWMFATAIATGNTFILKPSEKDPSAANFLAELLAEAGVPDGVFNVVHGDKVAVDAILEHPDIAAVSFVGSTPIARYIYETGTKAGKRVQALGGAKNHMIVLPDADIDMAADAAVSAGYGSAGERCMAVATIVAVGDVADPLVEAIQARLPKITVGPGQRPGVGDGPARHPAAPRQGRVVSRQRPRPGRRRS